MTKNLFARTLERIEQLRHLPESTYRLQLHAKFTFRDAIAILPYLRQLGITHVYASPYLKAVPGSTHGYNVIDHCRLNDELGSEDDYRQFIAALREHGLEHIVDIVPNHVGIETNENVWWNDVLANGIKSRYADYFDITWRGSPRSRLHDKVLLPVLGELYATVLEKGQLTLVGKGDTFWVQYFDRRFPISPESAAEIGDVSTYNGTAGDARSFDLLDELLNAQHYRLAWWETAPDEINYRRFFNVNSLAGLRMERREVMEETHRLTMELLADGRVAGLRVDHPDGLFDPAQYCNRLQQYYVLAVARPIFDADPSSYGDDWPRAKAELLQELAERRNLPLYVVVEKILGMDEPLPADWAVHGTTGYDFLALTNGLFVDPSAEQPITDFYQRWTSRPDTFEQAIYRNKLLVLDTMLASELRMLASLLAELAQKSRRAIDFTLRLLHEALRQTIACFPVYRSYITSAAISAQDAHNVETAIARAMERNPSISPEVFDYLRDMLPLRDSACVGDEDRPAQLIFIGKFQQLTSPATAKGIEDTTFYTFNRLVSLNEVGGNPGRFGTPAAELHRYYQDRQTIWPYSLSPLTTHDTKRSEDVRARLNVLSELPQEWQHHVEQWAQLNDWARDRSLDLPALDRNDEYLLYQTLLGAWPPGEPTQQEYDQFGRRIDAYMRKAIREAKLHTDWTHPNKGYEQVVSSFIAKIMDRQRNAAFFDVFLPFAKYISDIGMINSLSQTVLRLAAPGVADTYQGTELWDFSLVDPDNRRPVDYGIRRKLLDDLDARFARGDRSASLREIWTERESGLPKLLLTWCLLHCRRERPDLFTIGDYVPIEVTGPAANHVFAFLRRRGADAALIVVPRLTAALGRFPWNPDRWAGTSLRLPPDLPSAQFRHLLADKAYDCESIFEEFPVTIYRLT